MAIKKIRIGEPESFVPSAFCKDFSYQEGEISFDLSSIETRITRQGTIVEFPIGQDEQVFGFGLQFYEINQKGKKIIIRSNADPIKNTGDSHAPVPFFVTNRNRGFYFDTARYAEFYCGYPKTSQRTGEGDSADSTQELYATRAYCVANPFSSVAMRFFTLASSLTAVNTSYRSSSSKEAAIPIGIGKVVAAPLRATPWRASFHHQ